MTDIKDITLPAEAGEIRKMLEEKLEQYRGRFDEFEHPELQFDTICKIALTERLLEQGAVNVEEFEKAMREKYQKAFQEHNFDNAVGVIDDYVNHGGKNTFKPDGTVCWK